MNYELRITSLEEFLHHLLKFREGDFAVTICINLKDNLLPYVIANMLAYTQDIADLLQRDGATVISIVIIECLL